MCLEQFSARLKVKAAIDIDVNAAALGEFRWGASQGLDPSLYLTIGTGIGGGYIKDGKPLIGLLSPEMGHIRIPHDLKRDPFPGGCPFHGDCFEGLASGPAIEKQIRARAAKRFAMTILSGTSKRITLLRPYAIPSSCFRPSRIILGGGIMERTFLFPLIRRKVLESLNGYVESESLLKKIDEYIVPPGLGNQSGSLGAIALAQLIT